MLNAGHRRGATVLRCEGQGANITDRAFSVFSPKALAAIGRLPDTVMDRSAPISLKRRRSDEHVERLRARELEPEAKELKDAIATWVEENVDELRNARPSIPDALDDRAADGWEPLLALADAAGKEWSTRARHAAVELYRGEDEESVGVLLLEHIRSAFETANADRITTGDLLEALVDRDVGPWAGWWARDVQDGKTRGPASQLARRLRPFGLRSKTIWLSDERTAKGFLRDDFKDAFARYLTADNSSGRKDAGHGPDSPRSDEEATNPKRVPEQGSYDLTTTESLGSHQARTDRGQWSFGGDAGSCVVCGAYCIARDSEGRPRHPACTLEAAS